MERRTAEAFSAVSMNSRVRVKQGFSSTKDGHFLWRQHRFPSDSWGQHPQIQSFVTFRLTTIQRVSTIDKNALVVKTCIQVKNPYLETTASFLSTPSSAEWKRKPLASTEKSSSNTKLTNTTQRLKNKRQPMQSSVSGCNYRRYTRDVHKFTTAISTWIILNNNCLWSTVGPPYILASKLLESSRTLTTSKFQKSHEPSWSETKTTTQHKRGRSRQSEREKSTTQLSCCYANQGCQLPFRQFCTNFYKILHKGSKIQICL